MDPTTTLFTFLLQTHPAVQSVYLRGSWDNFRFHKMDRDLRRGGDQWKGCHTFKDIICDGDQPSGTKRNGGLKMGETYYYYYELDGSVETHDPSLPSTTSSPYMPGQRVNTLEIPCEQPSRLRSASVNSMRITDLMTRRPQDKYCTPRPPPPVPEMAVPELPALRHVGSSPSMHFRTRSARSLSPAPRWAHTARRFLGIRQSSRDSDQSSNLSSRFDDSEVDENPFDLQFETQYETPYDTGMRLDGVRSATPSSRSTRSRDMSPESLRRFLMDDAPVAEQSAPKVSIPEEITEEFEDDDNFATSAVSETMPMTTLSPPPFQRSTSSPAVTNASSLTIVPQLATTSSSRPPSRDEKTPPAALTLAPAPKPASFKLDIPKSHFSFSTVASSVASPVSMTSADSRDMSQRSFYDEHDEEDDDDILSSNESDCFSVQQSAAATADAEEDATATAAEPLATYSLPQQLDIPRSKYATSIAAIGSPAVVARNQDSGLPELGTSSTSLLGSPGLDLGLDDFVNDLSWMADVIRSKDL